MNVSETHAKSTADYDAEDNSGNDEAHFQDLISNISLQATSGSPEHPYIGKLGIVMASVQLFLSLCLVAATFILPHFIDNNAELSKVTSSFSVCVYSHCAVWLAAFIFDVLYSRHHRKLKLKGYIRFYRSVKMLQRHPFFVKSLFNTINLAVTNYMSKCEVSHAQCKIFTLTPIMWLQIITSLEAAVMAIGLIIYIGRVVLHNKHRNTPDDADDQMLTSFRAHQVDSGVGIGYRPDNYVDDIIENQADRIRSLQEQNSVLSKKLYSLTYKHDRATSMSTGTTSPASH